MHLKPGSGDRPSQVLPALQPVVLKEVEVLQSVSPKQIVSSRAGAIYPYYAGFSSEFVDALLSQQFFRDANSILDPWNGAGTTSLAAVRAGRTAFGFDLNPVMVLASKARLLNHTSESRLSDTFRRIEEVAHAACITDCPHHPLLKYFGPSSARSIRAVLHAIDEVLSPRPEDTTRSWVDRQTSMSSFFCVLLFRVIRKEARQLRTSNPTWTRSSDQGRRIALPLKRLLAQIQVELGLVLRAACSIAGKSISTKNRIETADSRSLPLKDHSVDGVITSPPYCTRIDYAIATRLELAALGIGEETGFTTLRRSLIGTTQTAAAPADLASSDPRVVNLLRSIASHKSKASSTYYLKTYVDYFSGMATSLAEISRVLRPGGAAALVVQDSYYKEIHIDLAAIVTALACDRGLGFVTRTEHPAPRSLRRVHPHVCEEARRRTPMESVLIFVKERE